MSGFWGFLGSTASNFDACLQHVHIAEVAKVSLSAAEAACVL